MRGRNFLEVARELVKTKSESRWRSAAGRAYYALFLEARTFTEAWGFPNTRRDQTHHFIRKLFVYTKETDLISIGQALERLSLLRNHADYDISTPGGRFASDADTRKAISDADRCIGLLDRIDADDGLRNSAIAAIRAGIR